MVRIADFLIDEEQTLLEAMEVLDKVAKKVLFVIKNNLFVASITDGDIRRWILKKGNLVAKVKDIANYNPQYLMEGDRCHAKDFMRKSSIEALPILNDAKDIVSIILWNDEETVSKSVLDATVVIMAGGLGTRLYPYTKILPKPLIPIGEIPISEHIVNRFVQQGANRFFMIINHKKNMIKAYFNDVEKKYDLQYIEETMPLGTGGGLSLLKGKMSSTFILSNCDILIEEDYGKMVRAHKERANLITMVCSLKTIRIPYGIVEISEMGEIEEIREKPEYTFFINTGMYIVEPRVVEELNDNEAIGFPDIIQKYKDMGERIGVYPISQNSWLDMGQVDEMQEMERRLQNE